MIHRLGLPVALAALLLAAGCQAAPPATIVTASVPATAAVTFDLAELQAASRRLMQTSDYDATIDHLELTVEAADLPQAVTGDLLPTGTFPVPVGTNRLFKVVAVNAAGNALYTRRAVATVSAGEGDAIVLSALNDAVGRAYAKVLAGTGASRATLVGSVAEVEAMGTAINGLLAISGYGDTYAGGLAPAYFQSERYGAMLLADAGTAPFASRVYAENEAALAAPSLGKAQVSLYTDSVYTNPDLSNGAVTVLTPEAVTIDYEDLDIDAFTFQGLPPGTWSVVWHKYGETPVWGTIDVPEAATDPASPVLLPLEIPFFNFPG